MAIAKPTWRSFPINSKFKVKFTSIQNKEIRIGVLVFSLAKKGTTSILIKTKAGSPKPKATSALAVRDTSLISNSPLKNRSFIISSDKNSIPKNAGIEKKIPNFIAFEIL